MRIVVGVVMVAAAATTAAADVPGTVVQLSTGSTVSTQSSPVISGSQVVWTSFEAPANYDIVLYDISLGASRKLTNTPDEIEFLPDIDAGNVIWTHTSATVRGDLVLEETAIGRRTVVASSTADIYFERGAIRGRWITNERVASQVDIDLYDYLLGIATAVTNDVGQQLSPRVSNEYVVYEDMTSGNVDVMGYSIPGGPSFLIAGGPGDQSQPDVDGTTVVYVDRGTGSDQLWAYDLPTGTKRQLTTVASSKIQPRISGSLVVWSDDRNGTLDVYSFDLATQTEERVVGGPGDQMLPDIDGNRIVYSDNASGFEQIYMFTVAPPPPPALVPHGCDPALTDAVSGPLTLVHASVTPVDLSATFSATTGRTYWVCIENGLADGSQRATHAMFKLDNKSIVGTADFRANASPPRYIDSLLTLTAGTHTWSASVFGPTAPSQITVTIRVDK